MSDSDLLDRLCRAAGIERVYHDQFGTRHEVAPDTIRAIVEALHASAGDNETARAMLAPATFRYAEEAAHGVSLAVPAELRDTLFEWSLREESGRQSAGSFRPSELEHAEAPGDAHRERRRLVLPHRLPAGYHRLAIRDASGAVAAETLLIVAPRRAYMPPALEQGPGIWGFAVQLYALRSERDWGIGDFGTLADFIRRAAAAGAGVIAINPLHALTPDEPEHASPYSPSSRSFLNALCIDVTTVPDFAECAEAQALAASAEFAETQRRLRAAPLVDYTAVARWKLCALDLLHASFRARHLARATDRARAFATFLDEEGEPLSRFCIFQALREARGAADPPQRDWRNWPKALADPASSEVAAFAAAHAARIEFFAFCQWIARLQLAGCAAAAREAGMTLGLLGDLAVGVDAAAGEAWAAQDVIVPGWSIGAPPDAWNRLGQNWGLSPLSPTALQEKAYRPFVALIRHNMRDMGALRIDHILGFWRTFWIRQGQPASAGAYVHYPFADLVAILALESQRARCVVVGEDLGTVPSGLREALAAAGILSYRLLYFEHRADGQRARLQDYPRQSVVAVGTHDLPPLAGYWSGSDIGLRRALGQFKTNAEADAERERRAGERAALTALLREAGLTADDAGNSAPIESAHRFLARTPGRIVLVQLEDALGLSDPVNVPGTTDEHPNWRRRLPLAVEALFDDERIRTLAAALNRERPRGPA